jgi:hypothetical protein
LNFEAAISKFCKPRKGKVDLCMTNGSKVLIYLTLLYFVLHYSKFNIDRHSTLTTSKGLSENLKKMSWDNPVSPIDAKNSISFLYIFFGVSLDF